MRRRRTVEFGFLLPWIGAFLLTPPIIIILHTWSQVAGFPLFILYVFACWLALIVAGGLVAARLDWSTDTRPRTEDVLTPEAGD